MVVTPWSIEARIAAIESASSFPPHIQPPTAQAPKITGVTLTSEWPNCLNFEDAQDRPRSSYRPPEGRKRSPRRPSPILGGTGPLDNSSCAYNLPRSFVL